MCQRLKPALLISDTHEHLAVDDGCTRLDAVIFAQVDLIHVNLLLIGGQVFGASFTSSPPFRTCKKDTAQAIPLCSVFLLYYHITFFRRKKEVKGNKNGSKMYVET